MKAPLNESSSLRLGNAKAIKVFNCHACAFCLLVLFLFLCGACDKKQCVSPRLIRLNETERIASLDSEHMEILTAEAPIFRKDDFFRHGDSRSGGYAFYVSLEIGADDRIESLPEPSIPLSENGLERILSPGLGLAFVVPVRSDSSIHIECTGRFESEKGAFVGVSQLDSLVTLPSSYEPLALREMMRQYRKKDGPATRLDVSDAGAKAQGVLDLTDTAKAVLVMVMAQGDDEIRFHGMRMAYITPRHDLLLKRKERGFDHPALSPVAFLEETTRPSILLLPDTTITFKKVAIFKGAEFRCSLGCLDPLSDSVTFSIEIDGERVLEESVIHGWQPVRIPLDRFAGTKTALKIKCLYTGDNLPEGHDPPLVLCGSPMIAHPNAASDLNVILISIDTLRADRLGCYGYPRPVSPCIDGFSERCFLFENAYSHAPYTLPSHGSLFTSVYPTVHGLHGLHNTLPASIETLAEILAKNKGMATAAFNHGGYLSHGFGFDRGFDLYCEVDPLADRFYRSREKGSSQKVLAWIDENANQPFFLFYHTMMVHEYRPPEELAVEFNRGCGSALKPGKGTFKRINALRVLNEGLPREDLEFLTNMYDAGIRATDQALGELLDHLESRGLLQRTVIVITSDHGEEFLDHGCVDHMKTVYNELIHVPLLVHLPGMSGGTRIPDLVSHVDVMPTLLDLLRIPAPKGIQGISLLPRMRGDTMNERPVYAETHMPADNDRYCIIHGEWKYIESSTDPRLPFPTPAPAELYNLAGDPLEHHNLIERQKSTGERMKENLDQLKARQYRLRDTLEIDDERSGYIPKEIKQKLHELGYL